MKILQISLLTLFGLLFTNLQLAGQQLHGIITNDQSEYLAGASINWKGSEIWEVANEVGYFNIERPASTYILEISYVGYEPVIIEVEPDADTILIELDGIVVLDEIDIVGREKDNFTSTLKTLNREIIGKGELKKAPCCNLSESFETTGSVDIAYSNAVIGTKEIQMLGLRGTYTQFLMENRPALYGLAMPFAFEFLPGTWMEGIQIAKGAGSVINGAQTITGQINAELEKPFEAEPLFVNVFGNSLGRMEANVQVHKAFNDLWSGGVLLHGSMAQEEIDQNDDGFLDNPLKKQLNFLPRIFYRGENVRMQLNAQAILDERIGGQLTGLGGAPADDLYRADLQTEFLSVFGKIGYIGFSNPNNSIGFIYSGTYHQQEGFFGRTIYSGNQQSLYANLIYNTFISNSFHRLNFGASYQFDQYDETFGELIQQSDEHARGVFVEYAYTVAESGELAQSNNLKFEDRVGIVAGLRLEDFGRHGFFTIPRLQLKYNFTEKAVARMSIGRGVRHPRVIAENLALLISSREPILMEEPQLEDAWNTGLNFTSNLYIGTWETDVNVDVYHTWFNNQIIIDRDRAFDELHLYNLDGASRSTSILTSVTLQPISALSAKFVYRWNAIQTTINDELRKPPLMPQHRGLVSIDYENPTANWMVNFTTQIIGPQRFPDNNGVPPALLNNHSASPEAYSISNAQVTRVFKNLELYAGIENLFDVTQDFPIIGFEEPFGSYFDASQIYAPIIGRRFYAGLRFTLPKKNN